MRCLKTAIFATSVKNTFFLKHLQKEIANGFKCGQKGDNPIYRGIFYLTIPLLSCHCEKCLGDHLVEKLFNDESALSTI